MTADAGAAGAMPPGEPPWAGAVALGLGAIDDVEDVEDVDDVDDAGGAAEVAVAALAPEVELEELVELVVDRRAGLAPEDAAAFDWLARAQAVLPLALLEAWQARYAADPELLLGPVLAQLTHALAAEYRRRLGEPPASSLRRSVRHVRRALGRQVLNAGLLDGFPTFGLLHLLDRAAREVEADPRQGPVQWHFAALVESDAAQAWAIGKFAAQLAAYIAAELDVERVPTPALAALLGLPGAPAALAVAAAPFRDGLAHVDATHATLALLEAIHHAPSGRGWTDHSRSTAPTYTLDRKQRGLARVSVRPGDGAWTPPVDALPALWTRVRALDDLTSDALLVCLAAAARRSRPDEPFLVSADAILDARGVKRKTDRSDRYRRGHRREDRLAAGRALAQLEHLWIDLQEIEVAPPRGRKPRRITVESRALVVTDRIVCHDPLGGGEVFLAARVALGAWAQRYWDAGVRQTALLAQAALAYDPYREQTEKRLAKYLALHFRFDAKRGGEPLRRAAGTLLDALDLAADERNPERTRRRLEAALAQLKKDRLIAGWGYTLDPEAHLPAKRWLRQWRDLVLWIAPPQWLSAQYRPLARVGRPPAGALPPA